MVAYMYKSDDTRTREREKGHPIASVTDLLDEHVVQRKKGERSVGTAFVPHTYWQHSVGIGEKERRKQADEITPSDLYSQTRFFCRSYAHIRSIPHGTPETERPITRSGQEPRGTELALVFSAVMIAGTAAIVLAIFSVCVSRSRIPHRPV